MDNPLPQLEALVLAHRYLYYVKSAPVLSDYEFDQLEKKARAELPESSPVHDFGSDSESSYSNDIRALAKLLTARAEGER